MEKRAVAKHVTHLQISAIKEMAMMSKKVKGAASLTWGVPSFETPLHIRQGVQEALQNNPDMGKYTLPDGLPALRRLAAAQHAAETGIEVDPDDHIVISSGNMQALNTLFHVLLDEGDEVILTDPCFASHIQQIHMVGGKPVYWALNEERGWALNTERLPSLITPKTKALVLVSPSNPTGKIFAKDELLRIGHIAKQHGIYIIIDDPYHHFIYDLNETYFNLAAEASLRDNLIYSFTFSKAYAMSGWRLAYTILPDGLKQHVLKVQDASILCTPHISQVAGMIALQQEPVHLSHFRNTLAQRRDIICERLDRLPHIFAYQRPEGAYYVFPKLVCEHENSREFSIDLLHKAKVVVTPGSAFGPSGEHHVRMAYCVDTDTIHLAFDRLEQYFGRE